MRTGRVTQTIWNRSVKKQIQKGNRNSTGKTAWEESSSELISDEKDFVWSSTSVSGKAPAQVKYAVIKSAGDLAAKRVRPTAVSVQILFPESSDEQELKDIIDKNIAIAKSYDEFVLKMRQENIFVNDSKKYITFQKEGKRAVRGKTLGDNYSEDKIIERIGCENKIKSIKENVESKPIDKIIDTNENKFQENIGLNRWANKKNMETADQLFNLLRSEGFTSVENLRNYIISQEMQIDDLKEIVEFHKLEIKRCQETIRYIKDYQDFKKYTYGLVQAKDKDAFKSKYENQLNKFFTAEKFLAKNDIDEFDDTKIIELNQEMGANAVSLSEIEKEIRKNTGKNFTNLKNLLKQLDTYLGNSKKEKTHDKFDMER